MLLQGAITLVLIFAASVATRDGFDAMVAYTAPVFWTFFLLTGMTLFIFRARHGKQSEFKAPFFPLTPLVFCAMCGFMLWKAVAYIFNPQYGPKFGSLVLAGMLVMAAGVPVYWLARRGAKP